MRHWRSDTAETDFLYRPDSVILKNTASSVAASLAGQTPVLKLRTAQELANNPACPPEFCQADAGSYWWRSHTSSRKQGTSSITVWAVAGRRAWCRPDPALMLYHPPLMAGASGSVSSLGETAPLKGSHSRFERCLVLVSALIRKFRHSPFLSLLASHPHC